MEPFKDALLRPEAYPHAVTEVGYLETHISRLFFAGERVYKVKKPVDLGFLDFTTLERRRHFCRGGSAPQPPPGGRTSTTAWCPSSAYAGRDACASTREGEVVEWAVEMRAVAREDGMLSESCWSAARSTTAPS